jgi:transcriptional regulator with GAF, ATPase, and Fis domain
VDDGGVAQPEELDAVAAVVNGRPTADHAGAAVFGRLAMELHAVGGVEETVEAVVQFALHALHCCFAGVLLIGRDRRPEVLAHTDPRVAALYRLQIEIDDGPLITAIREENVVLVPDVDTQTTWSQEWAEQVRAAGIRSAVHLPLQVGGRTAAILSLYSDVPDAFSADDLAVAHILARHASVAIATARQQASLAQAIDARKLVGQAMGILMERYDLDSDRAFEVLKRYSQQSNRKLRDVAQELIDTRRLPH